MEDLKYYKVRAKCGHVGREKFCYMDFYIRGKGKREAMDYVLEKCPGVKRQLGKRAIDGVWRVTREKYIEGRKISKEDPYFKCHGHDDMLKAKAAGYKLRTYRLKNKSKPSKREDLFS